MLKKLLYGILVGLGSAALAAALWLSGALDRFEFTPWSWRVRAFARPTPATGKIKVILLDQASLDWGKKENGLSWPWPREVYGPIMDFCRRGGAKAVAFDFLYTEPSVYGVADDEALGAAVGRTPGFVGAVFMGTESGDAEAWPEEVPDRNPVFQGLEKWLPSARDVTAPKAAFPIPEVGTNAAMLANVSDQPDPDGVFRRAALFRVFDGRAVPSLGLAAYLAGERVAGAEPELELDGSWLQVGSRKVPIDSGGRGILQFVGRSGTHEAFSAAAIIQSELRLQAGEKPVVEPGALKDCYVLLGSSAPGLLDLRPTPISKVYPGVEIQATMLDNLLSSFFLRDVSRGSVLLATLLVALLGGIAVTLSRRVWQSVAAFVVFLPVPMVAGFGAYAQGFWWPVVVGELAVALALVGGVVVNYATEGRQKAYLKQAFRHYLGAEVIEQLIADPSRLKLGGEKRELTLFFSDIEKFSSFSERLDPPTLTALLNDYLSDMGAIITEEGGYLDKYIGDAIVAFWNAPVAQPDHAIRACRAALRCQRKIAERREEFKQRTGATVKARIGINTGDVTVGNMGSHERFNYTVLGDAANLASRLEGANKAFGTYLMVSESTWSQAKSQFIGRGLGQLRVVGRQTPVRVFEVLGLAGESAPGWVGDYERGLASCRAGQWAEALKAFEKCPDDAASKVYAERCRKQLSAPSEKWDGVWGLTEK